METEQSKDSYRVIYKKIIDPIFDKICNAKPNEYCVKAMVGTKDVPHAIGDSLQYYLDKTQKSMVENDEPDRHKLASCLCGAIVKVRPLNSINKREDKINEIAAMYAGLYVIEYYMRYVFVENLPVSEEEKLKILAHFKSDFYIHFPESICDEKTYDINFVNALYRSHPRCEVYYGDKECFQFDIWAYSKIFYHLELYNQKFLEESYSRYQKISSSSTYR